MSLGTAEVGTVGTIGALPWTSTGIYVPEGVVARAWLRGKLQISYNQAFSRFCGLGFYRPNDCYGQGFDGHQVGGAGIDIYYLAADIRIRNGDEVKEIGFGKPANIDSDGDPVLASFTGPGIIEVSRTGFENQRFSWPNLGAEERYNVTGSQTLEVEALGRVDACGGVVLAGSTEPRLHADCVPPPKPEPKPRMKCTDPAGRENVVVRGGTILCRAVVDPDTSWVTATGWQSSFTAVTDKTVYPDTVKDVMPQRVLEGRSVTLPGPGSSSSWGGTVVVSTTISASVGPVRVSAAVGVEARPNWQGADSYPPTPEPVFSRTALNYPPVSAGAPELHDGALGISRIPSVIPAGTDEGSGPNEHWWFLTGPAHISNDAVIFLNAALQPSDPFFRAQTGSSSVLAWGRAMCSQSFMYMAARQVRSHEVGHINADRSYIEGHVSAANLEGAVYYEDPDGAADPRKFEAQLFADFKYGREAVQSTWDKQDKLQLACDFNTNLR